MKLIYCLVLTQLLCQCGYNWGHQSRELPGGHRTVYIEMFKNQTQEVGLESQFTRALTTLLERSGFAIVTQRNAAEVIVKGDILRADLRGHNSNPAFKSKDFSSSDPSQRTTVNYEAPFFTAYSLTIALNLRVIRSRDKQLIWKNSLSGRKSFQGARLKKQGLRSSNVLYNQARKKQTIKLIAQEMMSDAFDRLTENF